MIPSVTLGPSERARRERAPAQSAPAGAPEIPCIDQHPSDSVLSGSPCRLGPQVILVQSDASSGVLSSLVVAALAGRKGVWRG